MQSVKTKGMEFENLVFSDLVDYFCNGSLQPYTQNKTAYFTRNNKEYIITLRKYLGGDEKGNKKGSENDIIIAEKKLYDKIENGASNLEIRNREEGDLILLELKNYKLKKGKKAAHIKVRVAYESLAKNVILKPNYSFILAPKWCEPSHPHNFKTSGSHFIHYSKKLPILLDKLIDKGGNNVEKILEQNEKTFEFNTQALKLDVQKRYENQFKRDHPRINYDNISENWVLYKDYKPELEARIEEGQVIFINVVKNANLPTIRKLAGKALSFKDSKTKIYYENEPKPAAEKFAEDINTLYDRELIELIPNENNETLEEKLSNEFNKEVSYQNLKLNIIHNFGEQFNAEIPGVIIG
jgi:hypothetical protein